MVTRAWGWVRARRVIEESLFSGTWEENEDDPSEDPQLLAAWFQLEASDQLDNAACAQLDILTPLHEEFTLSSQLLKFAQEECERVRLSDPPAELLKAVNISELPANAFRLTRDSDAFPQLDDRAFVSEAPP